MRCIRHNAIVGYLFDIHTTECGLFDFSLTVWCLCELLFILFVITKYLMNLDSITVSITTLANVNYLINNV